MDISIHRYGIQCTGVLAGPLDTPYLVTLHMAALGPCERSRDAGLQHREDSPFYIRSQPMFCRPLKFLFGWKKSWLLDLDI